MFYSLPFVFLFSGITIGIVAFIWCAVLWEKYAKLLSQTRDLHEQNAALRAAVQNIQQQKTDMPVSAEEIRAVVPPPLPEDFAPQSIPLFEKSSAPLPTPVQNLELWVGRKLLGWVAAAGFILAAAFFIRCAVDAGLVGTGLKVAGIVVCGGFLLAWRYRSKLLGAVTVIGGLAFPVLFASNTDWLDELLIYLFLLNAGTVVLVNLLRRPPIACIAFFGTQILFFSYERDWVPYHTSAVLLFQSAFYILYLIDTIIAATQKKIYPAWGDALRAVADPVLFFVCIYRSLWGPYSAYEDMLGLFTFIGCAFYALLAVIYSKWLARMRNADGEPAYWKSAPAAAIIISAGFLAVAIPMQFSAEWIAPGWVALLAGLWYFGNRFNRKAFIYTSYVLSGLFFYFIADVQDL